MVKLLRLKYFFALGVAHHVMPFETSFETLQRDVG